MQFEQLLVSLKHVEDILDRGVDHRCARGWVEEDRDRIGHSAAEAVRQLPHALAAFLELGAQRRHLRLG